MIVTTPGLSTEEPMHFQELAIHNTPDGWVLNVLLDQFEEIPYQPLSWDGRLGKRQFQSDATAWKALQVVTIDRWILAVYIISHHGIVHCQPHGLGGLRENVAPQIDYDCLGQESDNNYCAHSRGR